MERRERHMPEGPKPEIKKRIQPNVYSFWETLPSVLAKTIGGKLEFEDGTVKEINKDTINEDGFGIIVISYPQRWSDHLTLELPGREPISLEGAVYKKVAKGLAYVALGDNLLDEDYFYGTISCDGSCDLIQKKESEKVPKKIGDLLIKARETRIKNLERGWANRRRWLVNDDDEEEVDPILINLRVDKKNKI